MLRDVGYLLLLISIPALVLVHLSLAPYTKVEESFHIQAIHDIETYGIPTRNVSDVLRAEYDHFTFPGAVPRTFAGAVVLSTLSTPFRWLNQDIDRQFAARAMLGLFNALSLLSFVHALRRTAGRTAATWYLLFQASQFHIIYYASRTLSNMFAFGITTLALAALLPTQPADRQTCRKRSRVALYLITIAGIVFRAELALFLATHTLFLLATGRIGIQHDIIPAGALGLILGLSITVPVDSFFWQQFPLWPELAAFKFNVVAGQASAWGTHPWHYYFTNAIPRLLLNPSTYLIGIPVALLQPATRRISTSILLPSLAYVLIYSVQPHKEWRFIVYAIPPLTAAAALGTSYIWTHRTKSLLYRLLSVAMIGSTLVSFAVSSFILLPASSANYPGAHALNALHAHVHSTTTTPPENHTALSIHLGNLACQTGVTRFLQLPSHHRHDASRSSESWHYDKSDSRAEKSTPSFWSQFDYLLLEPNEANSVRALTTVAGSWEDVETITGFAGLRVLRPGEEALGIVEEEILRKVCDGESADWLVGRWKGLVEVVRGRVTRGWWVEVRMEPRITVLKRVKT
ncbi:dolichyl-P-Man:Man(7)GlcNAc(2)-PP-dolichol alpha-1,6-mannosyltransferase [Aspergillus lucknowensis]|uniref:Mannosyltransferase n=1 Tax=Aspergillus lucknowensis TaxID=176173 RepID=A0ABR4L8J9_9EURO